MDKTAVDSTAEKYWTDYFGDYGRQWVRDIPRRIVAALIGKTAAAAAASAVDIRPIHKPVVLKDKVIFEGVARMAGGSRVFRAEFDHNGNVIGFESVNWS